MITKEDIKSVLNVAANIAQEESHRLEMAAARSEEEEGTTPALVKFFRDKSSTARKIEYLIRTAELEHFTTLRELLRGPEDVEHA